MSFIYLRRKTWKHQLEYQSSIDQIINSLINDQPINLEIDARFVISVVLASKGYPTHAPEIKPILNLDRVSSTVYHMGTSLIDGNLVNTGGRVLCVTGFKETLEEARYEVYQEIKKIHAPQCFYRTDIGESNRIV